MNDLTPCSRSVCPPLSQSCRAPAIMLERRVDMVSKTKLSRSVQRASGARRWDGERIGKRLGVRGTVSACGRVTWATFGATRAAATMARHGCTGNGLDVRGLQPDMSGMRCAFSLTLLDVAPPHRVQGRRTRTHGSLLLELVGSCSCSCSCAISSTAALNLWLTPANAKSLLTRSRDRCD